MLNAHLARTLRACTLAALFLCGTGAWATPQTEGVLQLDKGDRICLLGNALAERMQHHGWLETLLQSRFQGRELSLRNLGFGADELTVHQRTMNFGKFSDDDLGLNIAQERFVPWDRYLEHCEADVVLAFFGFNESFAGVEGLEAFQENLSTFIDHVTEQRYNGETAPRLVLFSSIPVEDLGDGNLPDPRTRNTQLALYASAAASVAEAHGVPFVDLLLPMRKAYAESAEPLTINGIHLNVRGNRALAEVLLSEALGESPPTTDESDLEEIRQVVVEKNLYWFNHYRATDGYNVYGGRSRERYPRGVGNAVSNFVVLQREMDVLDVMAANRDDRIWALASGGDIEVDDGNAPPLMRVETNFRGEGPGGSHVYFRGDEAREKMTLADGMRAQLFADEVQFPDLINPVQMAWDTRGRLWVAAWPTYPHWEPDLPLNDKLLILEDVDGDGHADTCKVFADDLHNPTGFEFWNGGVLVANAPDILFLKDTDGDDRADVSERVLHGLSSGDTHHSANSFVMGPGGAIYFQEGTFHQTQVETIRGPVRNHNGCVWRFDPRTWLVERYVPYNFANPHGHVFDRWGQDFVTDGTGNVNYYALPFSGHIQHPQKHSGYFPFFKQRSRPCAGTEILSSSHFPEANQGNYLIANVIGFQGLFQYEVVDDGSGFGAVEVEPIVYSADRNFRPTSIETGPDGALYVLDWHNAIVGHLQHHLRDPSRDRVHGRIYRITYEGRDLLDPPQIAGSSTKELLELLKSPEDRVRYRTRIELSAHDSDAVVAAAAEWVSALDPEDPDLEHHLLEALWLHQQHNRVDLQLLERVLRSEDHRARAAATRVLRYMRHKIPNAAELLAEQAFDEHPRVRLEVVVGASFFDSAEAASAALTTLAQPTDRFLDYALRETMRALEPRWKEALRAGRPVAADNPAGIEYLLGRVSAEELVNLPHVPAVLQALMTRGGVTANARLDAAVELAQQNSSNPATEVLAAVHMVDRGNDSHAMHVLHDLGGLLRGWIGEAAGPSRADLTELASNGQKAMTRELGYASLVAFDGSVERAWESASTSVLGLESFLGGVAMIPDPETRSELHDRVRPLMFSLPAALRAEGAVRPAGGTGLSASFYEPCPRDAQIETLDAMTPRESLHAPNFTLELPPAQKSDSYGLVFRGTVFAPEAGRYTFFTNSDDGSRLYIGDVCVVNNDGAHGMRETSGVVDLSAGPNPITVTYYEQGGGHGLQVSWKGPGIQKQPVPDEVLGAAIQEPVRAKAILAMAHIPGYETQKFQDAARFIGEGSLLDPALELLRAVPADRWPADNILPVIDTLSAYVSGLPAERRTDPQAVSALEVGRALAAALPEEQARSAREQLDGLGGAIILIRTLPHRMLYDVTEFWVEAGQPVAIIFQNNDMMPHNLVVTKPGAMERVGSAAELLSGLGGTGTQNFIPETDEVLWHTELLYPGKSARLTFVAPEENGDHPFVCTFPGHWRVMNGVMHVVDEVDEEQHVTRRETEGSSIAVREFVQDWTLADLVPDLAEGWRQNRSIERGETMFTEAGCIKCHTIGGKGATGGPELDKVTEKYRGVELLRTVLEPSVEILEGYHYQYILLEGGGDVIGRIVKEDDEVLHLISNLQEPEDITIVYKDEIEGQKQTLLSPMPTGLLVTLSREEILDLLAFLESTGD